jgi:hypothetical protein
LQIPMILFDEMLPEFVLTGLNACDKTSSTASLESRRAPREHLADDPANFG